MYRVLSIDPLAAILVAQLLLTSSTSTHRFLGPHHGRQCGTQGWESSTKELAKSAKLQGSTHLICTLPTSTFLLYEVMIYAKRLLPK